MPRIAIIGAGPAGMMAAIRAAECGADVMLIEKNNIVGKKLLLSGKGRCNLTNACGLDAFLERFSNGEFLRDAFKKFFNKDLMRFFEERGLPLKVERQLRVFPKSERAGSVVDVLKKELHKNGVKIIYNSAVKEIIAEGDEARGVQLADGKIIQADKVILATGGMSYKATGSAGDGFTLASKLDHNVISPRPGLVGLITKEPYPAKLEGLVLKNIRIIFKGDTGKITSGIGELLFTDVGISGPLVLSLSGRVGDLVSGSLDVYASVDLKPGLSKEQLEARLMREFKNNSNKSVKNILRSLLPARFIDIFLDILKIEPKLKAHQITQAMRKNMMALFKDFRLTVVSTEPLEKAMVTRGGVSLKEIGPRTMGSRIIKGLYFAGELIDVDADTGGFNLQAAFSTGYLAGESAASSLRGA